MPRRLDDVMMVCAFCGCEAWHIDNVWVKCFLCKRMFSKNLLDVGSIPDVNRQLNKIRKIAENPDAFGGFFNTGGDL